MGVDPFYRNVLLRSDGEEYEMTVVFEGDEYTFPIPSSRSGYVFSGWLAGGKLYKAGDTIRIESDMTLDAVWAERYTVTLDYDDGGEKERVEVIGQDYTLPQTPQRKGYIFSSWLIGEDSYSEGEKITLSQDTTVKAEWVQVNTVDIEGKTLEESADGKITLPLAPKKEGYHFNGWLVEGKLMKAGEKVDYSSSLTVSASWTRIYTVTLDYDDGGEKERVEVIGQDYTLPQTPIKGGYAFGYWIIGDSTYEPGEAVILTCDTLVTAKWTVINTVTVDNDGSKSEIKTSGTEVTLPRAPVRENYHFNGWLVNGILMNPADTVEYSDTLEIEASWTRIYTVEIDYDDGLSTTDKVENIGLEYTLPASPIRSGYAFAGWSVDGLATVYSAGDRVRLSGDTQIKALWNQIYIITIDYNDSRPNGKMNNAGSILVLPDAPSSTGSEVFSVWEVGGKTYGAGESVDISGDTTIKALWTEYYTVTIDYNSAVNTNLSWLQNQSVSVEKNSDYILPNAPRDNDWLFTSWTVTEESTGKKITGKKGDSVPAHSDMIMQAQWKKRTETYKVSFDTDGGVPALEDKTGLEGYTVTLSSSETPKKSGYTLSSWVDTADGTVFNMDEDCITKDTTLKAVWKETKLLLSVSFPCSIINIDRIRVTIGDVKTVDFYYPSDGVRDGSCTVFTLDPVTGLIDNTDYVISVTAYSSDVIVGDTVYDSVYISGEKTSKTVSVGSSGVVDITPTVTMRAVVDSSYVERVMAAITFVSGTSVYYTLDGSEPTKLSTPYTSSGEEFEVPGNTEIRVYVEYDNLRDSLLTGDRVISHSGISTYTIGATGPHGGIIFYDNGSSDGDWRFLEAATEDFEMEGEYLFEFGPEGEFDTRDDAGKGYDNCQYFKYSVRKDYVIYKVLHNFKFQGVNDAYWYVPSVRELELMRENLYMKGLGNFRSDFYWSSTTINKTDAYQIRFYDTAEYQKVTGVRTDKAYIRPITRF